MLLVAGLILAIVVLGLYRHSPPVRNRASDGARNANGATFPPTIRGKPVPDFELPNLNGKVVRFSDSRGKVVLVNFWATWCAPCVIEMPWFNELQKRYGPRGFQVIAISLDENPDLCAPFLEEHKLGNLMALLGNQHTADLFGGLIGLPTTFLVDRDGKLYSKHQGLVNIDVVDEEILELLEKERTD
ncbi:MAG TPA: TlpA disulfide reductase family protein [Pirellula sp.]|nr:TlpA disulfide reductase family protein [Pirellula sp.]